MKKINDGGPAFPCPSDDAYSRGMTGMNLREYFAGQAMAAMIVAEPRIDYQAAAEFGVKHADALITELERTNETQSSQVDPQADCRSEPKQA